jgi:hypothetical protein
VRLVAECAGIEQTLGHHDDAHRRLVAELDALPDLDSAEAVAPTGAIAQDRLYRTEYTAARDAVEPDGRRRHQAEPDDLAGTGRAKQPVRGGGSCPR